MKWPQVEIIFLDDAKKITTTRNANKIHIPKPICTNFFGSSFYSQQNAKNRVLDLKYKGNRYFCHDTYCGLLHVSVFCSYEASITGNENRIFLNDMNIGFSTRSYDEKASAQKNWSPSPFWQMRENVSGSSLLRIYLISLVWSVNGKESHVFAAGPRCFDFDPFLWLCTTPYGKAAGRWQAPPRVEPEFNNLKT